MTRSEKTKTDYWSKLGIRTDIPFIVGENMISLRPTLSTLLDKLQ